MTNMPVLDIDGHVCMECAPGWTRWFPKDEGERLERLIVNRGKGRHPNDRGTTPEEIYASLRTRNKSPGGWEPAVRIKDMDAEGIDVAVLFGTEMALNQDAYSLAACQGYNTWLAEYCAANPERLKGVALLPLGDMDAARRELRRAVTELGFVGIFMKPSLDDKTPDAEYFHPLYAEAQDLDVPIMFHVPHGANQVLKDRFHYDFVRGHAAMHPFSMMLAVMDVVYGGLLDRFPRLRFGFMEGQAGWVPWFLWRLDEQYKQYAPRPGVALKLPKLPSEYLQEGRLFFSCDPEEKFLPFAAGHLEDYIVWASDYPHSDGIFPGAVRTFLEQRGLTEGQKRKILYDNSLALLHGKRR